MGWLDALRRPRAEDPRAALVVPIEQALRALGWVAQVSRPRFLPARAAGQWPPRSDVAVAAWRNLDGQPGAESLLRLLAQLDERINKGIHAARG